MQRQYLGQVPFLVGLSFLVEIVQPFFVSTPFWTAILHARGCGLWGRFPIQEWECRTDQRMPSACSLNLFTGRPLLRATVASSEKKTIFGRRESSIRTTSPTHRSCAFMMSASMPDMLALRRDAHDLAKASEVKLIECYNDFL